MSIVTSHLQAAARCSDTTDAGQPCNAPAMIDSPWCGNHRPRRDPAYTRPMPKANAKRVRESIINERVAELRISKEASEHVARLEKRRSRPTISLIDTLAQRLEMHPGHVVDVILDGLRATTTIRRRKLNPDGTQASAKRYADGDKGEDVKVTYDPIFEDVAEPDWKMRIEFVREINDRLYGRPAQRKLVDGEIHHSGQVNVAAMLQAAKLLEADPDSYYSSLPSSEEPLDVGSGDVVASTTPV